MFFTLQWLWRSTIPAKAATNDKKLRLAPVREDVLQSFRLFVFDKKEKEGFVALRGRDAPCYCLRFARFRVMYSELSSARNAMMAVVANSGMGMLLRSR